MLEIYFGNDTDAVRKAVMTRVQSLETAGVEMATIDKERYVPGVLQDRVGATSLFGGSLGFVVDQPQSDTAFLEESDGQLEAMAASPHVFLVIEDTLLAAGKKKYTKHAEVVEEFKKVAEERFNTFALTDALLKKDKKQLWMLLQQAKMAGQSAEEIIGVLWWQLKTMRLVAQTSSPVEAGLKDFPYNKAKRALTLFAEGEVERLSRSLLAVYHDGHAGKRDIDAALEVWVLEV